MRSSLEAPSMSTVENIFVESRDARQNFGDGAGAPLWRCGACAAGRCRGNKGAVIVNSEGKLKLNMETDLAIQEARDILSEKIETKSYSSARELFDE